MGAGVEAPWPASTLLAAVWEVAFAVVAGAVVVAIMQSTEAASTGSTGEVHSPSSIDY